MRLVREQILSTTDRGQPSNLEYIKEWLKKRLTRGRGEGVPWAVLLSPSHDGALTGLFNISKQEEDSEDEEVPFLHGQEVKEDFTW